MQHKDNQGQTWKQFARDLFQFQYCDECGGDSGDHIPCLDMFGNWFAMCKFSPIVSGVMFRHGKVVRPCA